MQTFHASAVQLKAGPDKAENLAAAALLVCQAVSEGAGLVVLPEMFAWRGPQAAETEAAEEIPGPISRWAQAQARQHRIHLLAGSMLERAPGSAKCFNTALLADPAGGLIGRYRKIHLFDVDLPGKVSISESATRAPGGESVSISTGLAAIGMTICYDLRFPELFRALIDAGAEVIVVPSAFTAATGQAHWEPLLCARAIENQCFIVAANQVGPTDYGFADHGHSMIIDPWGKILAHTGGEGSAVVTARLDGGLLAKVRKELPCLRHRRLGV